MRRVVGRTLYGVGERLMFGYFGCYIYIYMRGRGVGGRERYHSRKNLFLSGSDCCIYTVL